MASMWGIVKARKMRGVDDRGATYQFWYLARELAADESPLAGWWAIAVRESKVAAFVQTGGNLVLTDRRLLWEPLRSDHRPVYGEHGVKTLVNAVGKVQDRVAPAMPLEWPLGGLHVEPADGAKVAVRVSGIDAPTGEFYFASGPALRGSAERRREFIQRIEEACERP